MAWLLEDETASYGDRVGDAILRGEAIVPYLWHLEMANALLVCKRGKRIHGALLFQYTEKARRLPITVDEYMSARAFDTIMTFADEYALTIYDATYLELAMRRGLPLATLDRELLKAAKQAGVKIFTP